MGRKIINPENRSAGVQLILQRVLRMVPDRDRADRRLQRLIAFRLGVDGEEATSAYLVRGIRDYVSTPGAPAFYDFLMGRRPSASGPPPDPDPPGAA
jgi:hypothetical protein